MNTCCGFCAHQVGAEACSRWGSDSWSHPSQENAGKWETQPWTSAWGWLWHTLSCRDRDPSLTSPEFFSGKETEPSPVLGFIFKLFHWSDGEIPKAEQRIVVASRQGQAGSGIKPCLASVERLKCFGRLRKCPFHFSIDWSLLNTHTSASAAFGGFSLGLFSFHFFHDFKCFWQ